MERIGQYFGISHWKFGNNFRKLGKSLGEIPVSASDNMNFSRDIHYFSRMQHPLIWKNIYPCIVLGNKFDLFNAISIAARALIIGTDNRWRCISILKTTPSIFCPQVLMPSQYAESNLLKSWGDQAKHAHSMKIYAIGDQNLQKWKSYTWGFTSKKVFEIFTCCCLDYFNRLYLFSP